MMLWFLGCQQHPVQECCDSEWTATFTLPDEVRGPITFTPYQRWNTGGLQSEAGIWPTVPQRNCLQAFSVAMGDIDSDDPKRFFARFPVRTAASFSARDYISSMNWTAGDQLVRLEHAEIVPIEVGPNRVHVEIRDGCLRHDTEVECDPQVEPVYFEMEGGGNADLLYLDVRPSSFYDSETGLGACRA